MVFVMVWNSTFQQMNNKSVQNLRYLIYCTCIFLFKSDNVDRYNFIKSILINLTPFSFISFKSNVFISQPVLSHSVILITVKVKGVYQLVLVFSVCAVRVIGECDYMQEFLAAPEVDQVRGNTTLIGIKLSPNRMSVCQN